MNLFCYCCLNMAPHQGVTKKWEVFAGRNKFFCDGYLMTAPNSSVFYFTVILITGTSGLFFAFDCPFLSERISPAIPIVGALLFLFTMSSLLRTSFSDPGVIPRASHDEAAYIEKQIEVPNSLNSPTYRPPPRTKEVLVKGQTVKLKYCVTCKIFRPPRASHCSICDNCVDRFDHHCPWVGNCVGKRNYRFFYMFIVSLAFLAVFIYACAMTHMVLLSKDNEKLIDIIKTTPASVIVAIICFFSVWSIIGLAGFHTYLTTSDQTTNEDIKGSFSSKGAQQSVNPYSQGNICLNCFHILCGPISPSLLDRRGIVTDEYRIQMQDPTRYNCTVPQPLVTQPIGSSDHNNTTIHIHDMEITPTLPNTGMYRQRSYDNLENGNSTSVTHLVDNELPLSILNSPNDININDDDNNIGNLSNLNNLSGSYNNLYRDDKLENDNDDNNEDNNIKMMIINDNNIDENIILDINNSIDDNEKSKIILKQQQQQQQQQLSENVYSNIPTTPPARLPTTITTPTTDNKINPNLHVYSNVTTSTPTVNTIKSTPIKNKLNNSISNNNISNNLSLISNNNNNNNDDQQLLQIKTKPIKIAQHQQQQQQQHQQSQININNKLHNNTINNSTSFINDLDLDDPVIETSAFGNLNNNNNLNNNINNNNNSNKNDDDTNEKNILKNNSLIKLNDVMNIKNVPQVVIIDNNNKGNVNVTTQSILLSNNTITVTTANTTLTNTSTITTTASLSSLNNVNNLNNNNNNSNNINNSNNNINNTNNNVFISPSRLRLLQDTTMIDTALDLDSLDGSSIGNTSQACLIKTAMV